jgi:hypothetical protein
MIAKSVILFLTSLLSSSLFAHGMDKPGPHNGFIKMPGAFHTEILEEKNHIKVYLLDISFKNPLVENSHVSLTFNGKYPIKVNCTKDKEYFICLKPNSDLKAFNEISVKSIRNNNKASDAIYELPLKLKN